MSSIEPLYLVFIATGFTVGFGHCIGMCGPIAVSLSLDLKHRSIWGPHLLYHSGRIMTYAVLGAIMGVTGSFTRVSAGIAGIQKGVMIFAGMVIVMMGFAMTGWVPLGRIFGDYYNPHGVISRSYGKLSGLKSTFAYLPLGLLLGLLPCGPVYTALIAAVRTGMEAESSIEAVFAGAGLMISFGLGTVPALLLVAGLADMGWLKNRAVIYKISSVLMIVVGIYFVVKGIRY
ncbi:MAG: sulfite exporter TauE/SafE family protein [Proteobacteria bacterium]|nr:sulfite exporter TauE/SafE family protein [Pseudomonadota bacterium]